MPFMYGSFIDRCLPTEGSRAWSTFLQSCLLAVSPWELLTCTTMGGHISIWYTQHENLWIFLSCKDHLWWLFCCFIDSTSPVFALPFFFILHYLKTFYLCVSIVLAVSGKCCCHCFCRYVSGLLGLWVKNDLQLSTRQKNLTTSS